MNIQDELQKIHHQYGTTEKANYEIQKMFDSEINKYKKKAEKWDKLGDEIEKYYESEDEDNDDDEYDREEGNLLDIGEAAASAYGYL
ncbi:hypothetical protein [Flavobacterium ovatum]|uniref:hypothetical protein n=1 Tax=Flavobacterium ovatum TaxID=1928857 RepID=UPI00345031D8